MKSYSRLLVDNYISPDCLIPEIIIGSYRDSYLVKWEGLKYDKMSIESVYVIHHIAEEKIITYFMEQLELKRLTFLKHALCAEKTWRSAAPE